MDDPFDSAWLKWGRAVVHAAALEDNIRRFAAQPNRSQDLTLRYYYDAKRHGFPVEVVAVKPLPSTWGLFLGDVATNLRSGLDHLAWAIVMQGDGGKNGFPLSGEEARGVSFPIYDDCRQFDGEIPRKLIGARSTDVARIRRIQPYHTAKRRNTAHAFLVLDQMCRRDKHRSIEPMRRVPNRVTYKVTKTRDCVRSADTRKPRPRRALLEVGTELGVIRVRKTGPNPHIEMQAGVGISIGVTENVGLEDWFRTTGQLIRNLLMRFADPPDQLAELGDPTLFFAPDDPRSGHDPTA